MPSPNTNMISARFALTGDAKTVEDFLIMVAKSKDYKVDNIFSIIDGFINLSSISAEDNKTDPARVESSKDILIGRVYDNKLYQNIIAALLPYEDVQQALRKVSCFKEKQLVTPFDIIDLFDRNIKRKINDIEIA